MSLSIQTARLIFLDGEIEGNAGMIVAAAHVSVPEFRAILFPELVLIGYPPQDLLPGDDFNATGEQASPHLGHLQDAGLTYL